MDDFDLSAYSNLGKAKKLPGIGERSSLSGGLPTLAPISNNRTSLVGAPALSPPTRHTAPKDGRPMTSPARPQGSASVNASMTSASSGIASSKDSQTSSLGASPILGRPKLKPASSLQDSLGQHSGRTGLKRPQSDLPGSRAAPQGSPGSGGQPQFVINSAEFEKTSSVPWVVNNVGPRRSLSPQRSPDSGRGSVASPFLSPANSGTTGFLQASPLDPTTKVGATPDVMKQLPSLTPQSLTSPIKTTKGNRKRMSSGQDSITSLIDNLNGSTPTAPSSPPTTNQVVSQHAGRRITKPLPTPQTPPLQPDQSNNWSLSMAPPISPVRSCVSMKSQTSISRETSHTSIGIRGSEPKPSAPPQKGSLSPSVQYSSTSQMQPKLPASPDSGVSASPSLARLSQRKMDTPGSEESLSPRSPRSLSMAGSSPSPFKPAVLAPIGQNQAEALTERPRLAPIKSADKRGTSLKPINPSKSSKHEATQQKKQGLKPGTTKEREFQPSKQDALNPIRPQQAAVPNQLGSKPVLAPITKAPFQSVPLKPINPSLPCNMHEAQVITEKQMDQTPNPLMSNSSQSNLNLNPALSLSPTEPPPFSMTKASPFNGKAVLAPINKAPSLQAPLDPSRNSTSAHDETQSQDSTEKVCEATNYDHTMTTSSRVDRFRKSMTSQESGPSQPSQQTSGATTPRPISIGRRRQTSDFWDSSSEDMSDQEELQDTRQESPADGTNHSLNQGPSSNQGASSTQSGPPPSGRRLSLASKKLVIVKRHSPNGNGSEVKAEFATIDKERIKSNNLAVDDLVPPSCYGRKSLLDLQRRCKEVPPPPVENVSETSSDESSKSFVFESPSTHHSYHTSDEDSETSDIEDDANEEEEQHHPLPAKEGPSTRLDNYRQFSAGTSDMMLSSPAEAKAPQEKPESTLTPAQQSKVDMLAAMFASLARQMDEDDAAEQKLAVQSPRDDPEERMPIRKTDVSSEDKINSKTQQFQKSTASCLAGSKDITKETEVIKKTSTETNLLTTGELVNAKLPQPRTTTATTTAVTSTEIPKLDTLEKQPKGILPKCESVKRTISDKTNDLKNLKHMKSESIQQQTGDATPGQKKDADVSESHDINRATSNATSKSISGRSGSDDDHKHIQTKTDSITEKIKESIPERVNDEQTPRPNNVTRTSSQAASKTIFTSKVNDNDSDSIQTRLGNIPKEIDKFIPAEVNDEKILESHVITRGHSQGAPKTIFTSSRKDDDSHSIQTKSDRMPKQIDKPIPADINDEGIPQPSGTKRESQQGTFKSVFTSSRKDDDYHHIQTKTESIPEEIEESIPEEVNDEEIGELGEPHDIKKGGSQGASKAVFTRSGKDDDCHSIQTKTESIPEEIAESIPEEVNNEEIPQPQDSKREHSQGASKAVFASSRKDDDGLSIQTKTESIPEDIEESIPEEVEDEEIEEPQDIKRGSLQSTLKTYFPSCRSDDDRQSILTKSESIPEEIEEPIPDINEEIPQPHSLRKDLHTAQVASENVFQSSKIDEDHQSIQTKSESIPDEIEESIAEEISQEELSETGNSMERPSQDTYEETAETVSEETSCEDETGSEGCPASLEKSGSSGNVADGEISERDTPESEDERESHSSQYYHGSGDDPETHDAVILENEDDEDSDSIPEEIDVSDTDDTSCKESSEEKIPRGILGRSEKPIQDSFINANSQVMESKSRKLITCSEPRSLQRHQQETTRHKKFVGILNAPHHHAQGKKYQNVKSLPGHTDNITPFHHLSTNEKHSTSDEGGSAYALVTESQQTEVNSSPMTSLFSSDPNKLSDESEMLRAQRNIRQSQRWSSSTYANMSIGVSGGSAVELTSPSGLSPTESTLTSQQQYCSSTGPTSQHASSEDTEFDKVSRDQKRKINNTVETKRGTDKTTKGKRTEEHKTKKKTSSSVQITGVSDNSQVPENTLPSTTKGNNASTSVKSKRHQQKEKDTNDRIGTGKEVLVNEDATTHSRRTDFESHKPSKEALITCHKNKEEESFHKSNAPISTPDKVSCADKKVSPKTENTHQKKRHKREAAKTTSGHTRKDGEDMTMSGKDSKPDQTKDGKLSTGILSTLENGLSEGQKIEIKHKVIQSWIINTTKSLADVCHGDSSTGATIFSSEDKVTTSSQTESRHGDELCHGMKEDLEDGDEGTTCSIKKLEAINRVPKVGSTLDAAAALRSQLMSRASQTDEVSQPQQTDVKTIPPRSASQVPNPTILDTPSQAIRHSSNYSSLTECQELCCRTRRKLARSIEAHNHIEAAPGTSMRVGFPRASAGTDEHKDHVLNTEVKMKRFMALQDVPSTSISPKLKINFDTSPTSYHKPKSSFSYSRHQQPIIASVQAAAPDHLPLPTTDTTTSYPIIRTSSFTPPFNFEDTIPKRLPHNGEFGLNGDHQHDMKIWRQLCNQLNNDIDNSSKEYYESPKIHLYHKESKGEEKLPKTEVYTDNEDDDDMDTYLMSEVKRKREEVAYLKEKYLYKIDDERRRVQELEIKVKVLEKRLTDQKVKSDIDLTKIKRETEAEVKTLQVQLNKKQHECTMMEVTSKAEADRHTTNMHEIKTKLKEMEKKIKLQEGKISQMTEQQEQLKNKNVAQTEEITSLKKVKSLLETSRESLHEKLEEAKTEVSKKKMEVKDWMDKHNEMVETLAKYKKGTKKLKKMLQDRDEQLAELTNQNKENTETVSRLEALIQAMDKESSQEKQSRLFLEKNLDNAHSEIKRLKDAANTDEEITAKVIAGLTNMLEEVKNQKKDLEADLSEKTESLKKKAQSEIELQDQKASLETEITSLREKLAEMDHSTIEEKQALTVARETENELREKVERYQDWIRESKRIIGNLHDSKDLLTRQVASLEFELSCDNTKREAQHDIVQRQLEDAKSKISRLEELLESKTDALTTAQFDLKEAQLKINHKEFSEQTKDARISALQQDIAKLREENGKITEEKLIAEMNLQQEKQCHQHCVRKLQNRIWALEQNALENAEVYNTQEKENAERYRALETENARKYKALEIENAQRYKALQMENAERCKALEAENAERCKALEAENAERCKALEAENAERCKALEAEKRTIPPNNQRQEQTIPPNQRQEKTVHDNQKQEQNIKAPNNDDTSFSKENSSSESKSNTTQEQQDMEEKLNNEIQILKAYLAAKIESLYAVEQLAEKQAAMIKKLQTKLRQMKQQAEQTETQENQHTVDEAKIKEKMSDFYKKKWRDKKKALMEEFKTERETMTQEIQELKQEVNNLIDQQNEHSSGRTSKAKKGHTGQPNENNHNTEHPPAEEQQQTANHRRQDPPCPCCSDTDESSDDETDNEA